jgi:site-specific recombinase XerD
MSMPTDGTDLHCPVESFFRDHLQHIRGASRHTVVAYRDALRLLFAFLARTERCTVAQLGTAHLHAGNILLFLGHPEAERGNSVATRNHRLAAIRSFCEHLMRRDPTRAGQYHRIVCLPAKKCPVPTADYLEPADVRSILDRPDRRTRQGSRDYAPLLFMYNTGARVGETLAVRACELALDAPFQVLLHGKGNKDRMCPLWPETVDALRAMMHHRPVSPDSLVFRNSRGLPLTRDGVAYILAKHTARAAMDQPHLARQRVTPHVLRHSCAVALLQAGMDLCVIRDYLGHASISTTSRYVKTNLAMKRRVLEAFWQRAGISAPSATAWEPKPDLLAFLGSL